MSSLHFFCTPLKNLSGDGRPSQSQETCLPNGVTQAGSWSNWLPAQLLFHQAAAQTLLQRALPCTQNARAQWRGVYRAAKSRAHSGPVLWARNLLSALELPYLQESQIHVGCHWFRHHTSSTMYNCTCTPADFSVGLYHLVTPSSSSTSSRLPPAAKRYIATSPHPEAALGHCLCQETSRNSYSAITCGVARGYLLVLLGSGGY